MSPTRRHGEPDRSAEASPGGSAGLPRHGDTALGLPEKLERVVFRDWTGKQRGTVELVDGKIVMSPEAAAFLEGLYVVVPGPREVTPADGELFLRGLLVSFRGLAFYAEPG